jgi:hypothetical protein
MNKKLIGIFVCTLLIFTIMPITVGQEEIKEENVNIPIAHKRGMALLASMYLELDSESSQAQEILDNFHKKPNGMLTNIDITVTEPNQDYYLFIGPFFRTFIPQILFNDSQSNMVLPEEPITLHVSLFWGDVREWEPVEGRPARLIIDGWVFLLSWKYL